MGLSYNQVGFDLAISPNINTAQLFLSVEGHHRSGNDRHHTLLGTYLVTGNTLLCHISLSGFWHIKIYHVNSISYIFPTINSNKPLYLNKMFPIPKQKTSMFDQAGLRINSPGDDRNQGSRASQTNTMPNAIDTSGNHDHGRPEGQERRQGNGKLKNRGKNHGKARWNNGQNNRHQKQHNQGHGHGHQNPQPHAQYPMIYSQHDQQGYYQTPNGYYPPGYHQQAFQQHAQQINAYSLGQNLNPNVEATVQNAFEQSKYVHGRNQSRHLGLSPSQQQALEEQKCHPNPSRSSMSSQGPYPYAQANRDFHGSNDPFQYQHDAVTSARNHMIAYHQQAHMNALAYQQMQPRVRQVAEGVWEMVMPNGYVQYWYEPQPVVMRAQAVEYVPLGGAGVSAMAAAPVSVMGNHDEEEDDLDGADRMTENGEAEGEKDIDGNTVEGN